MDGLIIAGFHRSGTSSVAQHLQKAGLSLGARLGGATEFNRYGHFEDLDVLRWHDAALDDRGLDWASDASAPIEVSQERFDQLLALVEARRRRSARAGQPWGFKDPRASLFLPHWRRAAPDVKLLIVFRRPAACVQSLRIRQKVAALRSDATDAVAARFEADWDLPLKLWVAHHRALLAAARRAPEATVVVGHHSFVDGASIADVVERRFALGLRPVTVAATLDRAALATPPSPLPARDPRLVEAALSIWRDLARLEADTAAGDGSRTEALLTEQDFLTGQGSDIEAAILRFQVELLERRAKTAERRAHAALRLARALDRLPLRWLVRRRGDLEALARSLRAFDE